MKKKFFEAPLQIIDGDRGKNYPKICDFSDNGYCLFLNTSNVTSNGFSFDDCKFISKEKDISLRKGKLKRNDIVLTTRGTVGNIAFFSENIPFENIRINSGMVILRAEEQILLPEFLYYFLQSHDFKTQITSLTSGSAQPQLPIRDLSQVEIDIPSLSKQKEIVSIVGSFDRKIELNRQMNQTLEEMALAIFKSWFVDYDPVRAKAEGRPTGLPAEIDALFPDGFEESEVGEIPRGWRVESLGDACVFAYGKALKEDARRPGTIPVYGSNGQIGWHDNALIDGPGIIIGRKGNPGTVTWSNSPFFPIDTTFYISKDNSSSNIFYLYFALHHINLPNLSADSAVPGLNRNLAYLSKLLIPNNSVLSTFEATILPLFELIEQKKEEVRVLKHIQNLVLPKLINGKDCS